MEIIRRDFEEPDRMAAQEEIIRAVIADPQYFLLRYCKDPRSLEGRYVNSDLMKEMFPVFRASKEAKNYFNLPVHNAAAALAAEQFSKVVRDTGNSEQIFMHFVTGTPGSGKTTAIQEHETLPKNVRGVYEGQLTDGSAVLKIQEALDAGLKPRITVVHTTAETAMDNAIYRYKTVGRGAGIAIISKILGDLPEGLRKIHEEYGNAVTLSIFDKRDQLNANILNGWRYLHLLESEGTHGHIKAKLSGYIEQIRGRLSVECYKQAMDLAPTLRRGNGPESSGVAGKSSSQQSKDGDRLPIS